MILRCLVVDDELPAREILVDYIARVPSLSLGASCKSALEALALLNHQAFDILFCDIKMPGLNGLDFLNILDKKPAIVLTSAYPEFALEGYDIGVTDYLLKPIRFERFMKAVGRAMGKLPVAEAPEAQRQVAKPFLFFKTDGEFVKVLLDDIGYIEAYGNYVRVHTSGKPLLVKGTLSAIEEVLDKKRFARIHKSYIVALAGVTRTDGHVVSLGAVELPVGSYYKKAFLEAAGL